MIEYTTIEQYISSGGWEKALECLSANLREEPDCAQWHYLMGKVLWRTGDRKGAITAYEHAAQLDPSSPAVHALLMARDIMDFYNPDLLNP